jgi:hypothetical protein
MTAQLLPNIYQQFFGINGPQVGVELAGGLLYSYAAGTTTPLATYTDETAGTPNTNPIVLNSVGAASIWMGNLAYKFKLTDSVGNVQWTVDNVSYINPGSVDLTKISGDIAGLALAQNGSGALDVQVDNTTLEINGSNQLTIKSVPIDLINTSSVLEVFYRRVRDFSSPGIIEPIPQYEWTAPTPLTITTTLPTNVANVTAWCPTGEFLAVGGIGSPYIDLYQYSSIVGLTKLSNPLTLPTGIVYDLSWSGAGDYLAVATQTSPYIMIYQRFGNQFVLLPNPASLPSPGAGHVFTAMSIAFSPNSDFLAWSGATNVGGQQFIMYERQLGLTTAVAGTFTGPTSLTTNMTSDSFSPGSGQYYVYVPSSGATVTVTGTASGSTSSTAVTTSTTFVDITTASTLSGIRGPFAWSPDSSYFAALDDTTGNIDMFERGDYIFYGVTGPATSAYEGNLLDFKFSGDGNYFAVAMIATPYVLIFESPTFASVTAPATLPATSCTSVSWSLNGEYLALGVEDGVTFYIIYKNIGGVFTAQTPFGTLPNGDIVSCDWNKTKQLFALVTQTSPYLEIYQTASTLPSNALVICKGTPNV